MFTGIASTPGSATRKLSHRLVARPWCRRSLGVVPLPVSRRGGKEIGDGCGIDAWNLSVWKRWDGSALVTFIPFGPGASVENPGRGIIQCRCEIVVVEVLPENFNILVRGVYHGVGKKALRKFKGFLWSSEPEDALCDGQNFVGVNHHSLAYGAK